MKVLLLGSGGRESALAWALVRSGAVAEVVATPGNPGIARIAEVRALSIEDPGDVAGFARRMRPDLVVVGPEAPLVAGVADALRDAGFAVFGPSAAAARIEASKSYAKELMRDAGIATATARTCTSVGDAVTWIDEFGPPYVVKADGLAAGKGVVVTSERAAAIDAIERSLVHRAFGQAGAAVVIEEFLQGQEASVIAFCDGKTVVPCEPAQDYKRVFDDDQGPNTGGMGSYSPVPACPPELTQQIVEEVLQPMVQATARRGAPFVGALYAGLALTDAGPKVIEFNARFGDPETQALLPRLTSDFGELCLAATSGSLAGVRATWSDDACVCVVLASAGYPGSYRTEVPISGIERAEAVPEVQVFHAGTAEQQGRVVTAGGRVLAVSARGRGFGHARRRAYEAAGLIEFEGKHVRSDIGARAEQVEATA